MGFHMGVLVGTSLYIGLLEELKQVQELQLEVRCLEVFQMFVQKTCNFSTLIQVYESRHLLEEGVT